MLIHYILLVVGFVLLYYGAEWLVKGSSNFARSLGVTPLVIGLTVVAFGTSAPELVVSLVASIQNKSMIAVGNVVGSNICNIALVLGLAAFLMPITSNQSVVRRDIPLMLAISLFLLLISWNSTISRFEGVILFSGVILYTIYNYMISKKESALLAEGCFSDAEAELEDIGFIESRTKQITLIIVGIAGVVIGAQVLIDSAVIVMRQFGVGEKFIGLTIVAFGTSLPELATSVVAALRKEMDISIGNLIGSNVFNILSVIGAASMVRPIPIPGGFFESGLIIDYCMMLGVSILTWVMMRKSFTVSRTGGFILLCSYIGYLAYLIPNA
ncbi:calcium/sodium antiporter [Desulfosarcina ovata]|uniref:Sodium:calcium antiporter n=2 Tax=Desulfosarcina ovata TaxID=83564 RepID=A0A5K8ADA2_9BACT|nr:calcium/sodium antiporter [Desulfosarcina ovata]BBO84065.1 sodium:calcium antiporter [Desulfosarcina ovata subsp. sediminis]BBO90541.1 sodium:calcium antiporter [Desulfosarcina ovata subsp. ovata]